MRTPEPARADVDDTIKELRKPAIVPAFTEVATGLTAGAALGALVGPPGIVAGALIGSVIGAAAGLALEFEAEEKQGHDEELDRDIGVFGGHLGEPVQQAIDDAAHRRAEELESELHLDAAGPQEAQKS